jgi:ubiquinone/menaquinone biosynthesis C-methylase UbiE
MYNNPTPLKQLFNKLAKHYYLIDFLSFGFSNYLRKNAIKGGFASTPKKVVDFMCGSGNNLSIIQKNKYKIESYEGYDFSTEMIQIATQKFGVKNNIHFFEQDLIYGNSNNIAADYIICTYGLKCIAKDDYENFVNLLYTALNKTGSFTLLEVQLPSSTFFKYVSIFYVNTICKLVSFMVTGNTLAAKALLSNLDAKIDVEKLHALLAQKGFAVTINKSCNNSVLVINGSRYSPVANTIL